MASPDDMLIAFGRAVREVRVERGMTQEGLDLETGIHRNTIGAIELAKRNSTLKRITVLANALDVSVAELMLRAEKYLD